MIVILSLARSLPLDVATVTQQVAKELKLRDIE